MNTWIRKKSTDGNEIEAKFFVSVPVLGATLHSKKPDAFFRIEFFKSKWLGRDRLAELIRRI